MTVLFFYIWFQLDWSAKLFLARGVVCGMEYLHSIRPHPVIHGDLKIQNILVGDGLVAKVCVFVYFVYNSISVCWYLWFKVVAWVTTSSLFGTKPNLQYLRKNWTFIQIWNKHLMKLMASTMLLSRLNNTREFINNHITSAFFVTLLFASFWPNLWDGNGFCIFLSGYNRLKF